MGFGRHAVRSVVLAAVVFAAACGDVPSAEPVPTPVPAHTAPPAGEPRLAESPEERAVALLVRAGSDRMSVRDEALADIEADAANCRDVARRELRASYLLLRRGAAAALSRIADASCVAEVVAALGPARSSEAADLIAALGRAGTDEAAAHLCSLVTGQDEHRGLLAASALRDMRTPFDLAALRAAARDDPRDVVRRSALIALSGHASADDEDFFRAATHDPRTPIRAAAAKCLLASPGLTEEDVRRLVVEDPEEAVRATAAQSAARAPGAVVIGPLAEALRTLDPEDDAVAEALKSLAAHREAAAFEALLAFLEDDTRPGELRGSALRGLARIDRERTITMLKREAAIFDTELRAYSDEILPAKAAGR